MESVDPSISQAIQHAVIVIVVGCAASAIADSPPIRTSLHYLILGVEVLFGPLQSQRISQTGHGIRWRSANKNSN